MKIEFIIPTWNRPEKLKLILQSLIVQTDDRWTAHVIIDGMTNDYFDVKNTFQDNPHIRFSHIEGPNNDWGHSARNYGLDKAQEEWIVMTGDDNYYMPTFVQNFLLAQTDSSDLVYCDMVHDMKRDEYQPIPSKLQWGWIDIGNFMCRKSIFREMRLDTKSYEADWKFVEQYQKRMVGISLKIKKVLYVHN